ncbi:MAG: RNA-binding protein [Ignavibacteriales bacterium CG07_land_8_20_14_0_80_59_12]|nr:MAG: RNA-binding protein [Ignavibacteriales bacterium CG07_land_8_20_14_0_80_59_12]
MRDFVEFIAKHLVDNPAGVEISEEEKDGRLVFKLKVSEPDIGKVIGRNGRTAQAMRTLLSAVAAKEGKRAALEIAG